LFFFQLIGSSGPCCPSPCEGGPSHKTVACTPSHSGRGVLTSPIPVFYASVCTWQGSPGVILSRSRFTGVRVRQSAIMDKRRIARPVRLLGSTVFCSINRLFSVNPQRWKLCLLQSNKPTNAPA
jgi:hypothetical protein